MYGILGEDRSDVETLKVIIRRLSQNPSLPIKAKGFNGCGDLLKKGASELQLFGDLGCNQFVICCDADSMDAGVRRAEVVRKIVKPANIQQPCCAVIPVQELEAWLLADLQAVTRIVTSWKPSPIATPERIEKPKEYLEKLSRDGKAKPRYSHRIHNPRLAEHVDLELVRKKCPSFRPLVKFVQADRS